MLELFDGFEDILKRQVYFLFGRDIDTDSCRSSLAAAKERYMYCLSRKKSNISHLLLFCMEMSTPPFCIIFQIKHGLMTN